eukprot:GGOE01013857.1.p1 GENE.GGOE01013857.1~~GGOE01013857.1.p1  ORF type:complete len:131 (-),score=36.14 GGOE01013857.1:129-521(-)
MVCTYFMIIGKDDNPIYEVEVSDQKSPQLKQFIMHAALDPLDELMWANQNFFFKNVDKFNEYFVSAHITPGYVKFLLLQDCRQEDTAKNFFNDVQELYLKTLLNPFYEVSSPITSPAFDLRVRALLRRHF